MSKAKILLTTFLILSLMMASGYVGYSLVTDTGNYYLDVPLPIASYYIGQFSNNSYFGINGSNWDCFSVTTNFPRLCNNTIGNSTDGDKVIIQSGNYIIENGAGNILVDKSVSFHGEACHPSGTNITIEGDSAFKLNGSDLQYLGFYDISFDGISTASTPAISSENMVEGNRIYRLDIVRCRFRNWDLNNNSVCVQLNNIEEMCFEWNVMSRIMGTGLYLTGTTGGNNRVANNYFGDARGNNTIFVKVDGSGYIFGFQNHFFEDADDFWNPCLAYYFNYSGYGSNAHRIFHITQDRCENPEYIQFEAPEGYYASGVTIKGNTIRTRCQEDEGNVQIYFIGDIRSSLITDNFFTFTGNLGSGDTISYKEASNGVAEDGTFSLPNIIQDNIMVGIRINPKPFNIIKNNEGFNPIGSVTSNFRNGNYLVRNGTNSNIANETTYTIQTTDAFITSVGGTGVNITIIDNNDNTLVTDLATINQIIPQGYKIRWEWTTEPTKKISFM